MRPILKSSSFKGLEMRLICRRDAEGLEWRPIAMTDITERQQAEETLKE